MNRLTDAETKKRLKDTMIGYVYFILILITMYWSVIREL